MIPLRIVMEGDGAFEADIAGRDDWQAGDVEAITLLERGTLRGKPSVALLIQSRVDGSLVVAETTWALLHAAVRAFEARYGSPA